MKITSYIIIVMLGISLGVLNAQAAALTSVQITSILQLLDAFGVDIGVRSNVESALRGESVSVGSSKCLDLKHDMRMGVQDVSVSGEVTKLQQFLAKDKRVYPEGLVTGYFGELTKQAISKWQQQENVEDESGFVGVKTRDLMRCKDVAENIVEVPINQRVSFELGQGITFSKDALDFEITQTDFKGDKPRLTVSNSTVGVKRFDVEITGNPNWLSFANSKDKDLSVGIGVDRDIMLAVNPSGLDVGTYTAGIDFSQNGHVVKTVPVTFKVSYSISGSSTGTASAVNIPARDQLNTDIKSIDTKEILLNNGDWIKISNFGEYVELIPGGGLVSHTRIKHAVVSPDGHWIALATDEPYNELGNGLGWIYEVESRKITPVVFAYENVKFLKWLSSGQAVFELTSGDDPPYQRVINVYDMPSYPGEPIQIYTNTFELESKRTDELKYYRFDVYIPSYAKARWEFKFKCPEGITEIPVDDFSSDNLCSDPDYVYFMYDPWSVGLSAVYWTFQIKQADIVPSRSYPLEVEVKAKYGTHGTSTAITRQYTVELSGK